jgi:hypothetical protein
VQLCTTPIGQPCTCEPMTWLYFVFVQSVFVFVGRTLAGADLAAKIAALDAAEARAAEAAVGRVGCVSL